MDRNVKTILVLWAVAVVVVLILASIPWHHDPAGPIVCKDGWVSPSSGGPGTCSHHGGER